jgi:hypothetical protein
VHHHQSSGRHELTPTSPHRFLRRTSAVAEPTSRRSSLAVNLNHGCCSKARKKKEEELKTKEKKGETAGQQEEKV